MAAALLRNRSLNSRQIKFELEATIAAYEEEKEFRDKQGPEADSSPSATRRWQEIQQEIIALEGLYMQAIGECFQLSKPPMQSEVVALQSFFEAMHGRRWLRFDGWLGRKGTANTRGVPPFSSHPWSWTGVEYAAGEAKGLRLASNQLQGELPGLALAAMSGLKILDLSDNEIGGTLPLELGSLAHLQYLRLNVSKLRGPIPDTLGSLKSLRELELSCAQLSGIIPPSLGCCRKLAVLNLSHNMLTGPIPEQLGELRALRELSLSHNHLCGEVPTSFENLARLRTLTLACNCIEGSLSPWVGGLTSLKRLLLDHNHLSGHLPRTLGGLLVLEVLHLQFNQLTGKIPRQLGTLRELRVLNLSRNRLQGQLPRELTQLTKLAGLELGNNALTGPLPPELGRLSSLLDFHSLEGCPSFSLPVHRGFTRKNFERIFVAGPRLGLQNTTYPSGYKTLNDHDVAVA